MRTVPFACSCGLLITAGACFWFLSWWSDLCYDAGLQHLVLADFTLTLRKFRLWLLLPAVGFAAVGCFGWRRECRGGSGLFLMIVAAQIIGMLMWMLVALACVVSLLPGIR